MPDTAAHANGTQPQAHRYRRAQEAFGRCQCRSRDRQIRLPYPRGTPGFQRAHQGRVRLPQPAYVPLRQRRARRGGARHEF